jgi:hypothetical protein
MGNKFSAIKTINFITANNKYLFANITFLMVLFFLAFGLIYLFRKKGNPWLFFLLLLYHTGMSIFYYFWQAWPPLDTANYYGTAKEARSIFSLSHVGRDYVSLIIYPFVKYTYLSFFSGFMLFNIIGFIGMIFFYITLKERMQGQDHSLNLLNLIIFLPGINFWTAPIGKEAILFPAIMMILYALNNLHQRIFYFALGSLFLALIRPHVFFMIILSLLLPMFFWAKTKTIHKIIFFPLLFILMVPAYSLLLQRTELDTINLDTAQEFIEERGVNWGGGSGVDIQNYNSVFKIFTYLYRPLFFDSRSIFMVLASCENLLYLLFTWQMVSFKFLKFIKEEKNLFVCFNLVFFLIGAVLMSHTEGNLGTAVRHKTMIMPSLLALFLLYRAQTQPAKAPANNIAAAVAKN